MSRAIDRHRARREEDLHGDGASSDGGNAGLAFSALAELATKAQSVAAAEQAKKDAAKVAEAEKAKNADAVAAVKAATDARHQAQLAAIDAKTAMAQADAVEPDKNGPQHKAAQKLADKAALLDANAVGAEAKAALYTGVGTPSSADLAAAAAHAKGKNESLLTPKNVAIGAGVVVGGAILWKLLFGKKGR